jgi:hypothetical protein
MNGSLRAYLRRAAALPPRVIALKAARLAGRRAGAAWVRWRDRWRPTYLPPEAPRLAPLLRGLRAADLPPGLEDVLRPLVAQTLAHRMDLLGSGWRTVDPPPAGPGISPPNRPRSAALRALLPAGYQPLDWHRDLRSGYRWDPRVPFDRVRFGAVAGADVKGPWELARLQHLPWLALARLLAEAGRWPRAEAEACAVECRAQILDLLASAPPRFGVLWACPMDVAIRAANIALTVDLLRLAGAPLDAPALSAVATALREHGRHVIAHLEWHDGPRTNHYLADLAGLAFCGAALDDAEGAAWMAVAAHQLGVEIPAQFLPDGGCFEGSTLYHRLSADLVLFPLALLLGRRRRWEAADRDGLCRRLRGRPPLTGAPLPTAALERVPAVVAFAAAIQRPDGRAPQVGDNDSGRLFKPHPTLAETPDGPREDLLDLRPTVAAGRALLGRADGGEWVDALLVRALAGGAVVSATPVAAPAEDPERPEVLAALDARLTALPAARRRRTVLPLPGLDPRRLVAEAFPHFGLYVLRGPATFIALRCVALDDGHEWGHTHDDNLHLEVWHDGREVVTDPGSCVYTADPPTRDRYRAAAAHFVPRCAGAPAVTFFAPFGAVHRAAGRCLAFGPGGMAAELSGPDDWQVWRLVRPEAGRLVVSDGCSRGTLVVTPDDAADPVTVSEGYGRQTARPVRSL